MVWGSYLPQIVGFFLIPLYTRYIAPREMGILEICMSAQALIAIFMRFGLPGAISRFYFDYREGQNLRDLVTTVVCTVTGFSLLILIAGILAGPLLFARFLPDIPFYPFMPLALVTAFFLGVSDFQRRLLESREESGFSARLSIAFGVASTFLTLLLLVGFHLGVMGILWANLATAVIFALVACWRQWDDLRGRFSVEQLKSALHYGLPLLPHHGASWAQQFIGRWVLAGVATAAMVGQLGLAARVASPLAVITGAFATAYFPVYMSWRSTLSPSAALAESRQIGRTMLILGAVAVIGAATFGGFVVRYTMQQSYTEAAPLVGLIAAALLANLIYVLITVEIFFTKNTKWISLIFIFSAAVNLLLASMFARRYGAMAAALAQVAGGIISVLAVSFFAIKTFPLPFSVREIIAVSVSSIAACLLASLLPPTGLFSDLWKNAGLFILLSALLIILSGTLPHLRSSMESLARRNSLRLGRGTVSI